MMDSIEAFITTVQTEKKSMMESRSQEGLIATYIEILCLTHVVKLHSVSQPILCTLCVFGWVCVCVGRGGLGLN